MAKSTTLDAVPASLRKPVASSRFAHGLLSKSQPAALIANTGARAAELAKGGFVRLPHEPEDARMTGVTRSLNRRLLALNIYGSRYAALVLDRAKIA